MPPCNRSETLVLYGGGCTLNKVLLLNIHLCKYKSKVSNRLQGVIKSFARVYIFQENGTPPRESSQDGLILNLGKCLIGLISFFHICIPLYNMPIGPIKKAIIRFHTGRCKAKVLCRHIRFIRRHMIRLGFFRMKHIYFQNAPQIIQNMEIGSSPATKCILHSKLGLMQKPVAAVLVCMQNPSFVHCNQWPCTIHAEHIFLIVACILHGQSSCHFNTTGQLLKKHAKWPYKSHKNTLRKNVIMMLTLRIH